MLKRRAIAGVLCLLLMVAGVGTAAAQTSPPSVLDSTTVPDVEEVTTVAPAQQPAAVAGDVVRRPLPRTGNDIGGTALFGGALTVLGVALALGARKRRNSFEGA